MDNRLAPWQRNMIALTHGITLKPSGKMKWVANIDVLAAEAQDTNCFSIFPIDADSEIDAARAAALNIAKVLFGEEADIGFVAPCPEKNLYVVTCGLYQGHGLTRGKSLSVLVHEYKGRQ